MASQFSIHNTDFVTKKGSESPRTITGWGRGATVISIPAIPRYGDQEPGATGIYLRSRAANQGARFPIQLMANSADAKYFWEQDAIGDVVFSATVTSRDTGLVTNISNMVIYSIKQFPDIGDGAVGNIEVMLDCERIATDTSKMEVVEPPPSTTGA